MSSEITKLVLKVGNSVVEIEFPSGTIEAVVQTK